MGCLVKIGYVTQKKSSQALNEENCVLINSSAKKQNECNRNFLPCFRKFPNT